MDQTYTIVLKLDSSGLVSGASGGVGATRELGGSATQAARDFSRLEKEISRAVKDASREIAKAAREATALFKQAIAERAAASRKGHSEETDAARKAAAEQKALLRQIGIEAKNTAAVRAAAAKQAARDEKAAFASAQSAYRAKVAEEQRLHAKSVAGFSTIKESIKGLAVAATIALAGIGALGKGLLDAAISAQQVRIGFDVAADSAAGGGAIYANVREEAYRLGLSLEETAKQYSSFAISARLAGLTAQETDVVFRGVAEAGTVLHLSAERMSLALLALEQAAGKGQVQMEELKRQLGNQIPGAVEIFARAMGVTVPVFYEMVKAGRVLATDLPKFGAELSKVFGPGLAASMKSAQAEMNRIKSALFELRAAAGEGLLEGLAQGFSGAQAALGADELKAQARELGKEIGNALRLASEAAIFLAQNIDKIKAALVLLLAVQAAGWVTKLGAAITALSGGVNTLTFMSLGSTKVIAGLNAILRTTAITAGGLTLALGAIGVVFGVAAFAMQSYITAQNESARVQQQELADSANVLRYLDQLRERKEKLTAEEYSLAEAIRTRLRAEETAANSEALKALYRLNDAKRNAPTPRFSESGGYIDDSARIKKLEQDYEDAKGKAGAFRGELTLLDQQLNRVGHETKKTAVETGGLSKEMERAAEAVQKQIRELQRLAEARKAEAAAVLAGPQAVQAEERRAFIADELAKAYERMARVKGGLDPSVAASLEAAAGAAYDAGKGLDFTKLSVERLRDAGESGRETAAALKDQLSGTAAASQELAARLQAEADVRGTVFDGIEAVIAGMAAENLARIREAAAVENQIRADQRERDSKREVAEAQARVTDARHQMTAASADVAAAIEIENLALGDSVTLFSKEWFAIVKDVEARRERIKVLTAEEALLNRQAEFARRQAAQRAEFADWKQQADAARKYGSTVAGILAQYGLLSDATRELGIQERALAIAREQEVDITTEKGKERLAILVAEQRGYEDAIDAVSRLQVEQELLADTLQPLRDAWASLGNQVKDILVEWAVTGKASFKDLAKSFAREMISAILEVLKRWILAEYAKRAESIKTAAISRAAVAASGGSGGTRLTDAGSYSTFFQGGGGATGGATSTGASASTLAGAAVAAYAIYVLYLAFIKDHRAKFAEATLGGGTRGNDAKSAAKLKELLLGLAKNAIESAKQLQLGLTELGKVTLGQFDGKFYVKDPGVNLAGVGRAFDTVEEAMEYVQVRAIQLGEVSDRVGLLVQQALKNSRAVTLEGLGSDIDFARMLQNAGLDASLAELQSKLDTFITNFADNWKRAIDLFGRDLPALAQALAGVGTIAISAFQAERDILTGKQRTHAEELALAQAKARIWNATKLVQESQIALMIIELKARIAAAQAYGGGNTGSGGRPGQGQGQGGTGTTGAVLVFANAMAQTAQVALTSAAVITASGNAQLDALRVQLAALEELQRALANMPLIDIGSVVVPGGGGNRGGGGGGTSKAEDAEWLKDFFEQFRRARLSDVGRAIAEINDRYEEARKRARGNAEELAKLNEQRQKEIDLIKKNLKRNVRDFIGKGGDLGAALRGVDDQAADLIKSYRDLHEAGEITTKELHQMVEAIKEAAAAQRLAIVKQAYSDVLISLLDATGKTNEAALERWKLSVLEYQIKIAELKIAIEKYHLEGFNIGRLEDLLDEYVAAGPPATGSGPPPPPNNNYQDAQERMRQRMEEAAAAAAKAREDALALLRRYQDQALDPFAKALRDLAEDFATIRRVLGDTAEVTQAYNAALLRLIENEIRPIQEWLNEFDLGGDRGLSAQDRLAEAQRQYAAVFAAVQGGDYTRIDELLRLADEMMEAQSGISPEQSAAYQQFVRDLRAQIAALQEQIRSAAAQGQVLGGGNAGRGLPPAVLPPGVLPPGGAPGGSATGGGGVTPPSAWVDPVVGALERTSGLMLVKLGQIANSTAGTQAEVRRVGDLLERSPLRATS